MLESQTHRKLIFGAVEVGFVLTRVVVGYWLVLETGYCSGYWRLEYWRTGVVTGWSQRDFTRPAGVSDP